MGGMARSSFVILGGTRNYTEMFGRAKSTVTTPKKCINSSWLYFGHRSQTFYRTLAGTNIYVRNWKRNGSKVLKTVLCPRTKYYLKKNSAGLKNFEFEFIFI